TSLNDVETCQGDNTGKGGNAGKGAIGAILI
ncbi:unnamed protein product, partial [Rotaria magnacalcarata]